MTQSKGLLLVTMEPPGVLEEEFHAWYDTEHLPQRRTVPGIETARRFVCLAGWPRYLALYDLLTPAVVESVAYQAMSGSRSTPWSRRLLAKVVGYSRVVAEQVYPGTALMGQDQPILRLVLVRLRRVAVEQEGALIAELRNLFEPLPGLIQLRVFKEIGAREYAGYTMLGLAEFGFPLDPSKLSQDLLAIGQFHPDLVNVYTPYWSQDERN